LRQGEDLVKAWRHPEGGFEKCFCGECGAHLFSRNPDDSTEMSVRMGAFDGDPGVRPSWRTFVDYAAVWEPIPTTASNTTARESRGNSTRYSILSQRSTQLPRIGSRLIDIPVSIPRLVRT
jgi:hypothetical protein